ncbi:hypothetical protein JCM11641_008423 [Rhodosporidiobolus odoratus]
MASSFSKITGRSRYQRPTLRPRSDVPRYSLDSNESSSCGESDVITPPPTLALPPAIPTQEPRRPPARAREKSDCFERGVSILRAQAALRQKARAEALAAGQTLEAFETSRALERRTRQQQHLDAIIHLSRTQGITVWAASTKITPPKWAANPEEADRRKKKNAEKKKTNRLEKRRRESAKKRGLTYEEVVREQEPKRLKRAAYGSRAKPSSAPPFQALSNHASTSTTILAPFSPSASPPIQPSPPKKSKQPKLSKQSKQPKQPKQSHHMRWTLPPLINQPNYVLSTDASLRPPPSPEHDLLPEQIRLPNPLALMQLGQLDLQLELLLKSLNPLAAGLTVLSTSPRTSISSLTLATLGQGQAYLTKLMSTSPLSPYPLASSSPAYHLPPKYLPLPTLLLHLPFKVSATESQTFIYCRTSLSLSATESLPLSPACGPNTTSRKAAHLSASTSVMTPGRV